MVEFGIVSWFFLSVGILSLFPAIGLFRQYKYTSIKEFLTFSGVFFSSSVMSVGFLLIEQSKSLTSFQLSYGCTMLFYFFLYIHATQILWDKPPLYHQLVGFGYPSLIIIIILLWDIQTQQSSTSVLFIDMSRSYSTFYPNGAGVTFRGTMIYSTSYRLLGDIYRLYVFLLLFYAYWNVEPVHGTKRVVLAKRLWITAIILHIIYLVVFLPGVSLNPITGLINITSLILITFITVRMPETILLSRVQLLRAVKMYHKISYLEEEDDDKPTIKIFGIDAINEYLRGLPEEFYG